MAISIKKLKIHLKRNDPDKVTVAKLKTQLTNVGLTCRDSDENNLANYINDVRTNLPTGRMQSYSILQPKTSSLPIGAQRAPGLFMTELYQSSKGTWSPGDSSRVGEYNTKLSFIQYEEHFDWLIRNRKDFSTIGIKSQPSIRKGEYDTVDSIKHLFVDVATSASSTLIEGLDKTETEAILTNAISPLTEDKAKNYDSSESRTLFLVKNYNPDLEQADAIGVLTIDWVLKIADYKNKKSHKHQTYLSVTARSVLYSNIEDLENHFVLIQSSLASFPLPLSDVSYSESQLAIPLKKTQVKIFDKLPPANHDTFIQGLPKIATSSGVDVIVLYAPDLRNIGVIENTNSHATTTYTKSLTSGFTFQSALQFSYESHFEASAEIVKSGIKIGLNISFTKQWSESQTETFSFSVPEGKKAYTYQGYMLARILRFNAKDNTYQYDNEVAQFVTNILTTSEKPLVSSN